MSLPAVCACPTIPDPDCPFHGRKHGIIVGLNNELKSQHREMRTLLLRIHSARVAMNEPAVIAALDDVDAFFREPNTN